MQDIDVTGRSASLWRQLLGPNSSQDLFIAAVIGFSIIAILMIIRRTVVLRLIPHTQRTPTILDDLIVTLLESLKLPVFTAISLLVAASMLSAPALVTGLLTMVLIISLIIYTLRPTRDLITHLITISLNPGVSKDGSLHHIIGMFTGLLLWVAAGFMILASLGVNPTTLIAGLGIGGVAVAFALQNILADLFSSLSLYADKPFTPGETIIIGQDIGTIKKIGIKTTRIQTLNGEELIISNKELSESRIHNLKRMEARRCQFVITISYDTPTTIIKALPERVRSVIENIDRTSFERCHFAGFGPYSLDIEIAYYITDSDYIVYMDVRQEVNLALKELFEKENITIVYPIQTVQVANT